VVNIFSERFPRLLLRRPSCSLFFSFFLFFFRSASPVYPRDHVSRLVHSTGSRYHVLPLRFAAFRLSYVFTGLTYTRLQRHVNLPVCVSEKEFQFYVGRTFDRIATTTFDVKVSRGPAADRRVSKCDPRKSIRNRGGA